MGTRYSQEVKNAVLELGRAGLTYAQIQRQFPVPKSTLSVWFKNAGTMPDRTRQLEHLKKARLVSAATKTRQRLERFAGAAMRAEKDLLKLSDKRTLKALLAMLYWAEGSKGYKAGGTKFVNTDPVLAQLYISLLRRSFPVDESRFRVGLHLHPYHSHESALDFWSKLLEIPQSQFWKIHDKKRSEQKRFRENFQGICSIYYGDGLVREELLALGRIIAREVEKPSSFNGSDASLRRK